METSVKLGKRQYVIQVVANCIKVEAPVEPAVCLHDVSQHPIAHTDILAQ